MYATKNSFNNVRLFNPLSEYKSIETVMVAVEVPAGGAARTWFTAYMGIAMEMETMGGATINSPTRFQLTWIGMSLEAMHQL